MQPGKNMDGFDRLLRGVAGIWLLAVAISAVRANRRLTAVTTIIASLGLLGNAASGFCGGNRLLGIDTTSGAACPRE